LFDALRVPPKNKQFAKSGKNATCRQRCVDHGDRIVLIAGTGLSVTAHNKIVVHELE